MQAIAGATKELSDCVCLGFFWRFTKNFRFTQTGLNGDKS